ncbi:zinc finger protein 93-like [Microcaecilia unicolor]|uniref:Zinc finger protein 93-like n=1 Tax=Microcaecilia unicolor TaxID=1415580 RepID=A0A6P7XCP1_9AMPH|nr:zinc finger protein 93-like [Microcaecilia unicolor]
MLSGIEKEDEKYFTQHFEQEEKENPNDPTKSLPIVTSVFSLSVKQEEDLPLMDHLESEMSEQTPPSVTSFYNVKPEILIRFEQERFGTEPQGFDETGNLTSISKCSQSYTAETTVEILKMEEDPISDQLEDDVFGNKRKIMRECDRQQRAEWKHKDSPGLSVDCLEGTSRIIPPSMKAKGERPNVCIDQERNSTQFATLNQNQRISGETLLQSTVFEERCIGKSHLRGQKEIHREDKPFHCTEYGKYFTCAGRDKNFSQIFELRRHELVNRRKKEVHKINLKGVKLFKCLVCDKSFTRNNSLRIHERIHTGEKPFKCPECDKCFNCKSDLRKHERIHTGVKPFKCPECDKWFHCKSDLKKHERIHTGVKAFKCSECDKCFHFKSDLRKHERIHTGEKPFKCSECDKNFTRKNNLRVHEKIHTRKKPFKCSEYNKSFN